MNFNRPRTSNKLSAFQCSTLKMTEGRNQNEITFLLATEFMNQYKSFLLQFFISKKQHLDGKLF